MPLLSGSLSVTRLRTPAPPSPPTFDDLRFQEIAPGSEVRESAGFVPFEPGSAYEIGAQRYAFRVRFDRLAPDPTAVRERLRDLIQVEIEHGGVLTPKRKKELRHLAEEELLVHTSPRVRIVEGLLNGQDLYIASTADTQLGKILQLLRRVGVVADFRTPWRDHQQAEEEHEFIELRDPLQSVHGCEFLDALMGDRELTIEPVDGFVRLQTRTAKATLSGAVLPDLHRLIESGAALLSAKLTTGELSFRLDGLSFRISAAKIPPAPNAHWTERLDVRLEHIEALWELLDRKYAEAMGKPLGGRRGKVVPMRST